MPYSLGCPVWACEHWRGTLFTSKAKRDDWLFQYSTVFNAVEGNSTFYALPSLETAERWAKSTRSGFEFCLKVPRAITHDKRLLSADAETRVFQRVLEILADGERLGPSFLQLSPTFDRHGLRPLQSFLNRWPSDFPLAVEVRHHDWFDNGPIEKELEETLRNCGADRVLCMQLRRRHRPKKCRRRESRVFLSGTRSPASDHLSASLDATISTL